jgi:hypothetical protein
MRIYKMEVYPSSFSLFSSLRLTVHFFTGILNKCLKYKTWQIVGYIEINKCRRGKN